MSDEPENLVLVYLRRLDAKMERMADDMQDVKQRLSALEIGQARIRQDLAELYAAYAGVQVRLDHIDSRFDRIERRLDLQDAHP